MAVLPGWDRASSQNRNFLNFPDITKDFSSVSSSNPFEFLGDLRLLLQETHESLNSDMVTWPPKIQKLPDMILFMSERDVDGKDSSSPGILQILRYEWTGIADPPHADRPQKPGLGGDLQTFHRLVEQRLKTCHSKILTLTGKQKRAQLIRDDPRSASAPANCSSTSFQIHDNMASAHVSILLTIVQLSSGPTCPSRCIAPSPVARVGLVLSTVQRLLGVSDVMPARSSYKATRHMSCYTFAPQVLGLLS